MNSKKSNRMRLDQCRMFHVQVKVKLTVQMNGVIDMLTTTFPVNPCEQLWKLVRCAKEFGKHRDQKNILQRIRCAGNPSRRSAVGKRRQVVEFSCAFDCKASAQHL
jgi:hypothetical protein